MTDHLAISLEDIHRAAERLKGHAVKTPLLEFKPLNAAVGRRVLVKFEGAQHTGSFKFRGAYNRLSAIATADRAGVWWPGLRAIMRKGLPMPPNFWACPQPS